MLIDIPFEFSNCFHACSILMLNPFFVFGILAGVSACQGPIGPVYAHFIVDFIALPLILDNSQKPSQVL